MLLLGIFKAAIVKKSSTNLASRQGNSLMVVHLSKLPSWQFHIFGIPLTSRSLILLYYLNFSSLQLCASWARYICASRPQCIFIILYLSIPAVQHTLPILEFRTFTSVHHTAPCSCNRATPYQKCLYRYVLTDLCFCIRTFFQPHISCNLIILYFNFASL